MPKLSFKCEGKTHFEIFGVSKYLPALQIQIHRTLKERKNLIISNFREGRKLKKEIWSWYTLSDSVMNNIDLAKNCSSYVECHDEGREVCWRVGWVGTVTEP